MPRARNDKKFNRKLRNALDDRLLDLMRNGRPVHDETGNVLYHNPPSAADISAAIRRLDIANAFCPVDESVSHLQAEVDRIRLEHHARSNDELNPIQLQDFGNAV